MTHVCHRFRKRLWRAIGAAVATMTLVAGCGTPDDVTPLPVTSTEVPVVVGTVTPLERLGNALVARYTFDDGLADGAVTDESGHEIVLRALTADGGKLEEIPRSAGLALRFPPPCQPAPQHRCPRAILEALSSAPLNPGTKRLRFGASLRLAQTEIGTTSHVMQKGFTTGGSQWRLQIDGTDGRPSCVVVGTTSPQIYMAIANVSIADGQWHVVACERHGTALTVTVDGITRGRTTVPAGLSIANQYPVRIGGSSTNQRNDQYFGALDDAYVAIG